jgi:hypothetical protein
MNKIYGILLAALLAGPASALTVKTDRYDDNSYSAILSSKSVVYLGLCRRGQFDPYEWSTWEGNFQVKVYVKAIAAVTVRRGKTELLNNDLTPYIDAAVAEARSIGGNFVCYAGYKKNTQVMEIEYVQFTVYRQIFISGNPNLQTFCQDLVARSKPMILKAYLDGSAFKVESATAAAAAEASAPILLPPTPAPPAAEKKPEAAETRPPDISSPTIAISSAPLGAPLTPSTSVPAEVSPAVQGSSETVPVKNPPTP